MTEHQLGPAEQLELLRSGAAAVDRSDRGFVLVTGPETFSFLQALVSADLDPLADGDAVPSLMLTPQGKLDVAFRLLRVGDDAWLDCDPGFGAQLAESLNRLRIRVKAEVVDRSGEWGMVSVIGSPSTAAPDHAPGAARVVPTGHGYDVVGTRAEAATAIADLTASGVVEVGADAYEAWRIEQGIPRQPLDIDGSTIPQEAFLERDAVSFTKGCFVGQELVCRIDSRGHVNRFLRRLSVSGARPEPGAEVVVDGKVVGAVTSVSPDGYPPAALAMVRREIEPPATVEVRVAGGAASARLA
jgi:folate-binding protein YgfZ